MAFPEPEPASADPRYLSLAALQTLDGQHRIAFSDVEHSTPEHKSCDFVSLRSRRPNPSLSSSILSFPLESPPYDPSYDIPIEEVNDAMILSHRSQANDPELRSLENREEKEEEEGLGEDEDEEEEREVDSDAQEDENDMNEEDERDDEGGEEDDEEGEDKGEEEDEVEEDGEEDEENDDDDERMAKRTKSHDANVAKEVKEKKSQCRKCHTRRRKGWFMREANVSGGSDCTTTLCLPCRVVKGYNDSKHPEPKPRGLSNWQWAENMVKDKIRKIEEGPNRPNISQDEIAESESSSGHSVRQVVDAAY